jgi:uncharacterized integral membrane protein
MAEKEPVASPPAGEPRRPPAPPTPPSRQKGPGIPWALIVLTAILVYAVLFVLFNDHEVEVDFVFVTTTTPLVFVIVLTLVFGIAIGLLVPFLNDRRRRRAAKRKQKP